VSRTVRRKGPNSPRLGEFPKHFPCSEKSIVTKPPKSLGPPAVVLVQWTLDNPTGAPDHLTSLVSKFLTFPKSVSPVTHTLQSIGGTKMRKQLQ
jgi:hypothetical protein